MIILNSIRMKYPELSIDVFVANEFNSTKKNKAEAINGILKKIADEKYPDPDMPQLFKWIFSMAAALTLILLVLILIARRSRLTKTKFETFHSGQHRSYRSEFGVLIDDVLIDIEQGSGEFGLAGCLPYKSEFEVLIDDILIGIELGSGEFGVVHKATAKGLGQDGSDLEVAVKKSKNLKPSEIKAFADELKIMMFLQKVDKESHVNIVNLLGSITAEIENGDIYAIMEFCQHGSLKDFILDNACRFKNELELDLEGDNNYETNPKNNLINYYTFQSSSSSSVLEESSNYA